MSICQRDDNETNEGYDDPHKTPSRTKKNKTRIPQNVISDDDDDDDIPITKHISLTNEEIETTTKKIMENLGEENPEIKEKIRKAKKNWEYLVDRMIQKRIDILREIVKKEKVENESDEEEDEKIDDILKNKSNDEIIFSEKNCSSEKIFKLSNEKIIFQNWDDSCIYIYKNKKLTLGERKQIKSMKNAVKIIGDVCVLNENEIVINYKEYGFIGDNYYIAFIDIEKDKKNLSFSVKK